MLYGQTFLFVGSLSDIIKIKSLTLISLIVAIISECIHVSKLPTVHFIWIQLLLVSSASAVCVCVCVCVCVRERESECTRTHVRVH